jgi:hypothetical protein
MSAFAERALLTAIDAGLSPAVLGDALVAAGTERAYADTGHALDFINKAFECLDLIGWEHAKAVLPTVVGQMVEARGAEESTAWRQPGAADGRHRQPADAGRRAASGGGCILVTRPNRHL